MKNSFRERIAYKVDNFISRGPYSIFLALVIFFVAGFILITVGRLAVDHFFPGGTAETTHNVWTTFLELTDPGNMNQDNESIWYLRFLRF